MFSKQKCEEKKMMQIILQELRCDEKRNKTMREKVHDIDYDEKLFKAGVVFRRKAFEEQVGNSHFAVIRNQCFTANGYFGSKRENRKMAVLTCPKLAGSDDERHFKGIR
ncbi:hypothetical protein NPIL_686761 [Nephila pilipes]|uniref:Uncharacterized protein n=1 Tax=Nephila pilipes TaxID=299642 RepID=A0A8X6TXD1_NEPPI|nr:hypothetical protein NPIL_686761 [Nephila pilipes]